jgi:cytochrome c oxidase cbb3-type subunit 4
MNTVWGHLVGVFIVLMMATFIGIWIWAWRKRRRRVFDRMARLPMEDETRFDDDAIPPTAPEDRR